MTTALHIWQWFFPPVGRFSNARLVTILRLLLVALYLIIIAVTIAVIVELISKQAERHMIAWAVSGIFVAIALPLPLNDILMHALHYARPMMQRYYIRILWLVPIYAIQSWLALRFYEQQVYFATARELYEAFVLWSFYSMLLEYFPTRDALVAALLKKGRVVKPMFPLCCMRPWTLGRPFIQRTSLGVLQYVIVRVTLTLISFVLLLAVPTAFGEGQFNNPRAAYVYFVSAINMSQVWAMYCLVFWYHELVDEMKPIRPLSKFLSIKAVVFLTFWQGLIISGLNFAGVIPSSVEWSHADVANGLQNFLICIEMAGFAIAHRFYFSYKDFVVEFKALDPSATTVTPKSLAVVALDMLPLDVAIEAGHHAAGLFGRRTALLSSHRPDVGEHAVPAGHDAGEHGAGAAAASEVVVVDNLYCSAGGAVLPQPAASSGSNSGAGPPT